MPDSCLTKNAIDNQSPIGQMFDRSKENIYLYEYKVYEYIACMRKCKIQYHVH